MDGLGAATASLTMREGTRSATAILPITAPHTHHIHAPNAGPLTYHVFLLFLPPPQTNYPLFVNMLTTFAYLPTSLIYVLVRIRWN